MFNFFRTDPTLSFLIVLIIVFSLLYLIVKSLKVKTKKPAKTKSKKTNSNPAATKDENAKKVKTNDNDEIVKKTDEGSGSEKISDGNDDVTEKIKTKNKTKSVEKIFKKEENSNEPKVEQTSSDEDEQNSSVTEKDLLSKMKFVKSSKHISKLVRFNEPIDDAEANKNLNSEAESLNKEELFLNQSPSLLSEEASTKDDENLENKVACQRHFDKSRRLSKCIKNNNFDELFESHISEKYLNINPSRHFDENKGTTTGLFERASQTIANSDYRFYRSYGKSEDLQPVISEADVEQRKRELLASFISNKNSLDENNFSSNDIMEDDDVNLNAKTLMVAGELSQRKYFKNKK